MTTIDHVSQLHALSEAEVAATLSAFSTQWQQRLFHSWRFWARPGQLEPVGDWRLWLMLAGRGFGKTRAGAEWVREVAVRNGRARIALIGADIGEVRRVMVEGESGLLRISPPEERLLWEPSRRLLSWPSGAQATIFSAADPESLRGPQHSHGWADELAKWDNAGGAAEAAWHNFEFGLRSGEQPRALVTTTPRNVALLRTLVERCESGEAVLVRGTTADNEQHLAAGFVARMRKLYAGSALGRQELDGELLVDRDGALWTRALLDECRIDTLTLQARERLVRIVVAVDPPASAGGDECGIVVAGRDQAGLALVLCDASVAARGPEHWVRSVKEASEYWNADCIVAEANQGGDMIAGVMRAGGIALPVKLVHATHGKVARAEPIAQHYRAQHVTHCGTFAKLEDQLCGLDYGGGYAGPGRSPDRADALVWALHELLMGRRGEPSIRI